MALAAKFAGFKVKALLRTALAFLVIGASAPSYAESRCITSPPNVEGADLQGWPHVFVGVVTGYRLSNTTLATALPNCPPGVELLKSTSSCVAFWKNVVSIQFRVETSIKGLDGSRIFEETTYASAFKGCPLPIGQRLLVADYVYLGVLTKPATSKDVALWKRLAADASGQ